MAPQPDEKLRAKKAIAAKLGMTDRDLLCLVLVRIDELHDRLTPLAAYPERAI